MFPDSPEDDCLRTGEDESEDPGADHHDPGSPPLWSPVEAGQGRVDGYEPVTIQFVSGGFY